MTISDAIRYVGVNDTNIDLFESQYPVPHGVSYNSYLLLDDKIALLDTVDKRKYDDWAARWTLFWTGAPRTTLWCTT